MNIATATAAKTSRSRLRHRDLVFVIVILRYNTLRDACKNVAMVWDREMAEILILPRFKYRS